jgi:hypothetical protein
MRHGQLLGYRSVIHHGTIAVVHAIDALSKI